MSLTKKQNEIMKILFKQPQRLAAIHTLYIENRIPLSVLFTTIEELKQMEFIKANNLTVEITKIGAEFMLSNPNLFKERQNPSKGIPEGFRAPPLGINNFYLTRLDKRRK